MKECIFELNSQPMSALKVGGWSFPAFSGRVGYMNKKVFACTPDLGPIPPGRYYILDRQSGGALGSLLTRIKGHQNWFSLYADDGRIDDKMYCKQVERGSFRLHPKTGLGISKGCITVESAGHFNQLRAIIKSNTPINVKGTDVLAYGVVVVK